MHVEIAHKSSKVAAITKVKQAIQDARPKAREHNVEITEERWDGDTLNFGVHLQGKAITGTLQVSDTHFIVDAKLPLLWRIFEGKIEQMIAEQAKMLG